VQEAAPVTALLFVEHVVVIQFGEVPVTGVQLAIGVGPVVAVLQVMVW
jgi:hypothetical protein